MLPRLSAPLATLALLLLAAPPPAPASAAPALNLDLSPSVRSSTCPIVLLPDEPTAERASASASAANPRIVNGDLIADSLAPYLVSLHRPDSFFKCTGTLVSERWVLSAAHCEMKIGDLVKIGTTKTDETPALLTSVSAVDAHPSYIVTPALGDIKAVVDHSYDIVAVQLADPAPASARFMKVNVNPAVPKPKSFVRIAGFGTTEFGTLDPLYKRGRLRQVDLPVSKRGRCRSVYSDSINDNAQVCAGYEKGGCDSCQGDSGGPMIQYTVSGEPILMAVVSVGNRCALPKFPGVYVRTAAFGSWLREETGMEFTGSSVETEAVFESGLGTLAIIGIAVAVVAGVVIVVGCVVLWAGRGGRKGAARRGRDAAGGSAETQTQTAYLGLGGRPRQQQQQQDG